MDCNIQNRTIFCRDNLEILQEINSSCIDLIYLDPPFNKNKVFSAPIGSSAEGASFSDIFREEDVQDEWLQTIQEDYEQMYTLLSAVNVLEGRTSYNFCYLSYMAIRLIEMHRILKDTGSIYLHCDPTMSHYLKILMDCIFGEQNFRNEIVWGYRTGGISKKHFPKKHDINLCYGKTSNTYHNPVQETILYEKPFFTDHTSPNENGKYETDVYVRDVWEDIKPLLNLSKERTGYPTQKPLALLERIIKASSQEGDIVLDPFCGCATTCVAAELLDRKWVGIDVSKEAYHLVELRLKKEIAHPEHLFDSQKGLHFYVNPPKRTDIEADYREQKYVYIISNAAFPNMYKVGIAKDWKSRLNAYQSSDPDQGYKMEFHCLTPCFREIKSHIHNRFESKHEWVTADLSALREAIENYKQKA